MNCILLSCSVVSDSLDCMTPWNVAHQASLSMEFSRQEYWSGLPYPLPEDLPNPENKPRSPTWQVDSLPSEPPGKLHMRELRMMNNWFFSRNFADEKGMGARYTKWLNEKSTTKNILLIEAIIQIWRRQKVLKASKSSKSSAPLSQL